MRRGRRMRAGLGALAALVLLAASCGGEIVGVGNSGNRLAGESLAEEVAEAIARHEGAPAVSDELLGQAFDAIAQHARQGDAEAALIVFRVAERQRKAKED